MKDQEIIECIRTNDLDGCEKAMTIIYREHYFTIEKMVLSNSGNKEDAKDVFQEALMGLYKNVKSGKFELKSKLSTYLFSVAKNQWLKNLNSTYNKVMVEESQAFFKSSNVDLQSDAINKDQQKIIINLLSSIGGRCHELLHLVYYERLKMEVIAKRLNWASAQEVRNQKSKCMKKLRAIVLQSDFYKENLKPS